MEKLEYGLHEYSLICSPKGFRLTGSLCSVFLMRKTTLNLVHVMSMTVDEVFSFCPKAISSKLIFFAQDVRSYNVFEHYFIFPFFKKSNITVLIKHANDNSIELLTSVSA